MLKKWKETVSKLKQEVYTLYLASKDPNIPFAAKIVIVITVSYALSPIDLIPDFIPIIGYLDDLIILPLGIWLSLKLIPKSLLDHYRQKAAEQLRQHKPNFIMAAFIIIAWLLIGFWLYQAYMERLE